MLAKSKQDSILANVSRRGFMKATAALGASAALYGCGSNGEDVYYYGDNSGGGYPDSPSLDTNEYYYGTGGHNCGAKCVSKAWVKNGRIIRITSVGEEAISGVDYDPNSYGNPQERACARCRSYKYRLYHPGRLKYPLKQTKERGNLSGFIRVSWDDAMLEICKKHYAIINKYGPESIYSLYACGSYTAMQGGGYTGIWTARSGSCVPLNYVGGAARYEGDYSYHQRYNWSENYTGYSAGTSPNINQLAGGTVKNLISFGDNSMTTRSNTQNAQINAYKMAKDNGTNIIFIAPEFVDTGVNIANEFIPTKPYTTSALLAGMLYEMIVNTFDENGNVKANPWLDVNYLDTAVYGFFDSPEYWIKKGATTAAPAGVTQGTISLVDPGVAGYTKVNAVPAGMSYSAWLMGDDDRLTKARYDAANNYVGFSFSGTQTFRNMGLCSQPVAQGANTAYLRKQQYRVKKDAAWASNITGIPVNRIKELARMWTDPAQHPIWCTHGFGVEKQLDGIFTRFALNAFLIVTKTLGRPAHGMGFGTNGFSTQTTSNPNQEALNNYSLNRATTIPEQKPTAPNLSVAQWHNAIKMAFMDVMLDPNKGSKVYTAKYIPDYTPTTDFTADSKNLSAWKSYKGRVYHDDGGAKALVKLQRDSYPSGNPLTDPVTGMYLYEKDANNKPVYSGYRWIMNSGGNILMNQHMNPNDTKEVLESIPSCGQTNNPDDPDDLCIISLDNFLSPSPRFSDYVFPMSTQWEHDNYQSAGGQNILMPAVSTPPGESLSTWNMTVKFLEAYEKVDTSKKGMALQFTGSDVSGGTPIPGDQYIDKFRRAYNAGTKSTTTTSRYYGKSFEEALKVQYALPSPATMSPVKVTTYTPTALDNYLEGLKLGTNDKNTIFYANISTATSATGYGGQYINGSTDTRPLGTPGRYQVYTEMIEWGYARRYEKWHKHLLDQGLPTGQRADDIEGDPIIPRIPYYFNYEDSFMEAYGGPSSLPPANNRFLVTTTHDRHRAHSSVAESPLVRELTHRVSGGAPYSCNDWGTYALSEIEKDGSIPRLNSAIGKFNQTTNKKQASWHEVWINRKDAERLGIADGDIVEMSNPVGAVRVAARLTNRCAKGYVALHQGAWYDPDPVDGVDDGGCANTIMCMKPSRLDHGNGQQSAMVTIKKAF